jgi:hypothetical protein
MGLALGHVFVLKNCVFGFLMEDTVFLQRWDLLLLYEIYMIIGR